MLRENEGSYLLLVPGTRTLAVLQARRRERSNGDTLTGLSVSHQGDTEPFATWDFLLPQMGLSNGLFFKKRVGSVSAYGFGGCSQRSTH